MRISWGREFHSSSRLALVRKAPKDLSFIFTSITINDTGYLPVLYLSFFFSKVIKFQEGTGAAARVPELYRRMSLLCGYKVLRNFLT